MAHFNTATLKVWDLNKDMAISTMKKSLRASRFIYSLDKILPQTYTELSEHVNWIKALLIDVNRKERSEKKIKEE